MKYLRGLLKFLGYTAFFLVALVFFVYLTLPLGEVQDFLTRKAADEYNAELVFDDEDGLDTCGLTCVEANAVKIKFRGTPEERAEYTAKLKAYQAERKALREAKADAKAAGAKSAASAAPGSTADATGAKTAKDSKGTKGTKPADDGPKRPEDPSKTIKLDRLKIAAAPFKLIGGTIDGSLEAELLKGTIDAQVAQSDEEITLTGTVTDLDASQLDALRQIVDLPIVGTLSSEMDLVVPVKADRKGKRGPDLEGITGTVGLTIANAALGPGQIIPKGKNAFPFDVPKTRIQSLGGQLVFARKQATFENFKIRGKDLEGEVTGYSMLRPKLKDWRLNAHINFKFTEAFLAKNRDVKLAMKNSAYLKKGRSGDYTGFNIHGTVGKVKFRPRKKSTSRGARTSRSKGKSARKTKTVNRKSSVKSRRPPRGKSRAKSAVARRTAADARLAKTSTTRVRKGRSTATAGDDDEEEVEEDEEDEEEEAEDDEGEGSKGDEDDKDDAKDEGDEPKDDGEDAKDEDEKE